MTLNKVVNCMPSRLAYIWILAYATRADLEGLISYNIVFPFFPRLLHTPVSPTPLRIRIVS